MPGLVKQLSRVGARLPAPARSVAQTAMSAVDPLVVRRYRKRHGTQEAIPPVALRARIGTPGIAGFLGAGEHYEQLFEAILDENGRSLSEFRSVLDFGCGCGRTLVPIWRHHRDTAAFHGCDIDEGAIAWLRQEYPALRVAVNGFNPPLPYADESFDLLYSISVFTHLDEPAQTAWLHEVKRVLRPGGVALCSFHGEDAFGRFASGDAVGAILSARERISSHSLSQEGFVFEAAKPSRWNALRFIGDDGNWGLAFHSEDYVREHWGAVFGSLEVRRVEGGQHIAVLRP